jgi:hypothetical protein
MAAGVTKVTGLVLLTATVAGLACSPAGAHPRTAHACDAARSRTIAETQRVRVYAVRAPFSGFNVRACWKPTGRSMAVGQRYGCVDEGCGGVRTFRIAGAFVAFERSNQDKDAGSSYRVVVVDVWHRRQVRSAPTGALTPEQAEPPDRVGERHEGIGPVTDLALRPNGSVAWIARDLDSGSPPAFQVHRADRHGRALLATATDIDSRSLRAADHRITWTQAGDRRSASLD